MQIPEESIRQKDVQTETLLQDLREESLGHLGLDDLFNVIVSHPVRTR
ncbi:hypothetical protein [Microbacterium sp. A93]